MESELILLGTEVDGSGIPWALLARELDGELEFAGPAIPQNALKRQRRGAAVPTTAAPFS